MPGGDCPEHNPTEAVRLAELVQCVPNFSEGRRPEVVERIVEAIRSASGVQVVDHSMDADHNRSVVTFLGEPGDVRKSAFALARNGGGAYRLESARGRAPQDWSGGCDSGCSDPGHYHGECNRSRARHRQRYRRRPPRAGLLLRRMCSEGALRQPGKYPKRRLRGAESRGTDRRPGAGPRGVRSSSNRRGHSGWRAGTVDRLQRKPGERRHTRREKDCRQNQGTARHRDRGWRESRP